VVNGELTERECGRNMHEQASQRGTGMRLTETIRYTIDYIDVRPKADE